VPNSTGKSSTSQRVTPHRHPFAVLHKPGVGGGQVSVPTSELLDFMSLSSNGNKPLEV
jgi:hypothetical protein